MARRKSYSASFKLEAIKYSQIHGTSSAAAYFEVNDSLIRRWRSEKLKLERLPGNKRACRYKIPKALEIEDEIYTWIIKKRQNNRAVKVKDIRIKARQLAVESEQLDFSASASWCQSFMARKKLSVRRRTSIGQPLPHDHMEKCAEFRRFVQNEMMNISAHNLGNMDEVPVPFDIVFGRTVDRAGKDSIKIDSTGHEKSNFTVVLAVMADGQKLKPMLIFKKKLMPKGPFPDDVVIKTNTKGWMTQELMQEWIEDVWNKREHHDPDPSHSLLILDSARCHLTEGVRNVFKQHSKVAVIPGGLTKILQPLDVGVNKPFKDNLRDGWERWMADKANAEYTKSGIRKRMSYNKAASLVSESFYGISEDTIIHSFEKALYDDSVVDELNSSFNSMNIDDDAIEIDTD